MGSPKHSVDLERELSCSICADLLYKPLTLLDCLHTFCGACVKEWFGWQATAAENAPTPPAPDSPVFTCPACRAPVRDTRRNATVSTLLEMFLAANPDKARPDSEKSTMDAKYKPGEVVLPRLNILERTPEQLRLDEDERRLIDEVRALSLQEAVAEAEHRQRRARRRGNSDAPSPSAAAARGAAGRESRQRPSGATPVTRSREPSADARAGNAGRPRDPARDARERERRRRILVEAENRLQAEQSIMLQPESRTSSEGHGSSGSRRRHRSESRQRPAESSEQPRRRHIEHQSSIRSLISSSSPGSVDIDREIEEFARQIQEEGLLDGLDLENLDLTNNDELSRKITEAYRRRQRERSRPQPSHQRSDPSSVSRQSRSSGSGGSSASPAGSRPQTQRRDSSQPPARPRRHSHSNSHARSVSATNQPESGRTRTPPSSGAFLDVRDEPRYRRRTASGGRSSTVSGSLGVPAPGSLQPPRAVVRSQTDISPPRPSAVDGSSAAATRPGISDVRSSSSQSMPAGAVSRPEHENTGLSFSNRVQTTPPSMTTPSFENNSNRGRRAGRPADIGVAPISNPTATDSPPALSPAPQQQQHQLQQHPQQQPQQQHHQQQNQQQQNQQQRIMTRESYPEPNVSCSKCQREHIEYEVHYNCATCDRGSYNLCLKCYREGRGCRGWYGFGNDGRRRWERAKMKNPQLPERHALTASRFLRSDSSWGIFEDPAERLQRGAFCSRCQAWAADCYWQCGACNDGDWGFCNDCVNRGNSCTHPLLPISYQPPEALRLFEQHQPGPSIAGVQAAMPTPPHSPAVTSPLQVYPFSPTSPRSSGLGVPRPMMFKTRCDVCQLEIPPAHSRYHCYKCASGLEPDSKPGNYDICQHCYEGLVQVGKISEENGPQGWRRCPKAGDKMVVVGFREVRPGRWYRLIQCDMVGGRDVLIDPVEGAPHLQRWQWTDESGHTVSRLVTADVRSSAPATWPISGGTAASADGQQPPPFPPDGGTGQVRQARWSWYPPEAWNNGGAMPKGQLLFPKGAEIHEVKDINGDFSSGTYMGYNNVFPTAFLRQADERGR
ncbi:hypothetical protein RB596_001310 [Gaeumannomyces avenae]